MNTFTKPIPPKSRKIKEGEYPEQLKSFKRKQSNTMKNIAAWFLVISISITLISGCHYIAQHRPYFGTMQPGFALLVALATAFAYVNFLNPFKRVKPFNCVTCLTGWIALTLAFCFGVPFYCAYLPLGVLIGGLFERLKMRYL